MRIVRLQWLMVLFAVAWLPVLAQADDVYQGLTQFSIQESPKVAPCSAWELDEADKDKVDTTRVEPDPAYASACQPECRATDVGCGTCCRSGCRRSWFSGVTIDGWIDQGITLNPASPVNRFNGPVTFNDRSNDYQMNQLWLSVHRDVNTRGYGFDVGGGIDVNYGTDSRFMWANGLDDDWSDSHRFYGLSMPQLYLDLGWNDLTLRIGHFCSIIGYEKLQAPENFFYSHTYMKQYAEPFTHTGVLALYPVNDQWSVSAGITNGWNNWTDNNDNVGFLGGATWTSRDRCSSLAFACTATKEDYHNDNDLFMYSLVYQKQLTNRLQWVLQHDYAFENNGATRGQDAEWYGLATYFYYQLNRRWSAGFRYEWFSDDDGVRVEGMYYPHGIPLNAVASHWQDISIGVKYEPNERLIVRSECRWDWVDPLVSVQDGPFDDFNARDQFLWSMDVILRF